MSIWRTIRCKCGSDSFEVADNGIDYSLRITCSKCLKELKLKKEIKLPETLYNEGGLE